MAKLSGAEAKKILNNSKYQFALICIKTIKF